MKTQWSEVTHDHRDVIVGKRGESVAKIQEASPHRIGHTMGKETIAESVDNLAILEALRTIGVDDAQGNAIAKPAVFGQLRRSSAVPRRVAAA